MINDIGTHAIISSIFDIDRSGIFTALYTKKIHIQMNVYLDNNILVEIEEGSINIDLLTSNKNVSYYYSEIHMDELMNGLSIHPELKETRLHTIEQLCGSNYLVPDVGPFKGGFKVETPQRAFEMSMLHKHIHDQLYKYSISMRVNRDTFLEGLDLKKIEVGNYKPSEIFKVLDEKLRENWGYGIDVYLQKSLATIGRTVFSSLFNLLDYVCYWHDKNFATLLYDSSHAYFAQFCDVLVSNDRRMRIKSEAVYSYLGIKTKVYTADEYLMDISSF